MEEKDEKYWEGIRQWLNAEQKPREPVILCSIDTLPLWQELMKDIGPKKSENDKLTEKATKIDYSRYGK